jgi:serine/threonine protein kinase
MSKPADYLVGILIGEGAYGRVVHGQLKSTKKHVAVKVMDKVGIRKRNILDRVKQEQVVLQQWNTSLHVVKLLASFHDEECLYFVMECCTGGDLTHWIQSATTMMMEQHDETDNRTSKEQERFQQSIPHFALQLLGALEFIHSEGVIHADLKPDNVLVTKNGRLKLADFGSCIRLGTSSPNYEIGTADYASPEQVRASDQLTVAVDLWAFGCILHAMWTGASPFHAESDALCIHQIVSYAAATGSSGVNDEKDAILLPTLVRLPEPWQCITGLLLHPNACERLGATDTTIIGCTNNVMYTSIRAHGVFDGVDLSKDPPYMAPAPKWWQETSSTSMSDGAEGWSVFLL